METPSNSKGGLSMADLRAKLQGHLRTNGALKQLKTQLRSMILSEVVQVNVAKAAPKVEPQRSWSAVVADAVTAQHLLSTGRVFSQSVFSSEAALSSELSSESDLRRLLALQEREDGSSILSTLINRWQQLEAKPLGQSVGVQCVVEGDSNLTLEQRLAIVDADCTMKLKNTHDSSRLSFEMQLVSFRQAIELEAKEEIERQVKRFKSTELIEMRKVEAERYQGILRHKNEEFAEMERTVQHRLELERSRLEQLRRDMELRAADLDRRTKSALAMVQEKDEQVVALELQLRESNARLQRLRADQLRYEDLAAQRLQDLENARSRELRRIDDIRKMQADNLIDARLRSEEIASLRVFTAQQEKQKPPQTACHAETAPPAVAPVFRENVAVELPSVSLVRPTATKWQDEKPLKKDQSGVSVGDELASVCTPPRRGDLETSSASLQSPSNNATTAGDQGNHHLSQLSSIAAQSVMHPRPLHTDSSEASDSDTAVSQSRDHHPDGPVADNSLPSLNGRPSSNSSSSVRSSDRTPPTSLGLQQLSDDEQQQRATIVNDFELESKELTRAFAAAASETLFQKKANLVSGDEASARDQILQQYTTDFNAMLWDHKRLKDRIIELEDEKIRSQYGGRSAASLGVVAPIVNHSDDSGDEALLHNRSDDDDESF